MTVTLAKNLTSLTSLTTSPLHPLTQDILAQAENGQEMQHQEWLKRLPHGTQPLPKRLVGNAPLVASASLLRLLDERVSNFCRQLKPRLQITGDAHLWPKLPLVDTLSFDFSIVKEESDRGWGISCVELQAFTSVVATGKMLNEIAADLWPLTKDLHAYAKPTASHSWQSQAKNHFAPVKQSILLEADLNKQTTAFDFYALQHYFSLDLVDTSKVFSDTSGLFYTKETGAKHHIEHIVNRVILHTTKQSEHLTRLLGQSAVSWHSHPLGFYHINKATMPELALPKGQRATSAAQWRKLGVPASQLVLKANESFGGSDVFLHVTEQQLDTLLSPDKWLVQERFSPLPLLESDVHGPIFGEIRCIVLLSDFAPWTAMRLGRLYYGQKASATELKQREGEGVCVLLTPPAEPFCAH